MLGLLVSGGSRCGSPSSSTPFLIRYFRKREHRPAHPRGRAGHPQRQGGHARPWAASPSWLGVVARLRPRATSAPRSASRGPATSPSARSWPSALIGFLDDWIKVRHQRSLGLNKRAKSGAQVVVRRGLRRAGRALGPHLDRAVLHPHRRASASTSGQVGLGDLRRARHGRHVQRGEHHRRRRRPGRRARRPSASPSSPSWATGSSGTSSIYHVLPASAIDLALVAVALAGACIGFLWWNAAPAKIIMGDTGSLAIGAGLAALCLLLNLDLLLLDHRRALRHGDGVGDPAGHQLPRLPPAHLPHGAHPPPLRARRLARDHGHRALLDPRRPLLSRWASASSTATS